MTPSQPDFLLQCDDVHIKPLAIFTDGFEYHCSPNNRLADDLHKRRAILESGNYLVWSLTWDDLMEGASATCMVCPSPLAQVVQRAADAARAHGQTLPDPSHVLGSGLEQLKAWLDMPDTAGWQALAQAAVSTPLQVLASNRRVALSSLHAAIETWRTGQPLPVLHHVADGDWVYNDRASLSQDLVTCMSVADAGGISQAQAIVLARIADDEAAVAASDFRERWRRFLACMNLYQFCDRFTMWTTSEARNDTAPDLPLIPHIRLDSSWMHVVAQTTAAVRPYLSILSAAGIPVPRVEYYHDHLADDLFAELAWPDLAQPVAVLVGDQAAFASQWLAGGWMVVTLDDLQANGVSWLVETISGRVVGV
jgi:DEAD/DEAH box helicase domain-containing protein